MSARILVVDDVAANVKVLEAKLEAAHYSVLTAMNGADALSIVADERPDLVLLDVMMPGMDGFECCRRLKRDPNLAHIPVVMVTALDQPSDRISGLEAGADDFLTKPTDDVALFARVRSLVRVKMMIDELRLRDDSLRALGVDEEAFPRADISGAKAMIVESREQRAETIAEALKRRIALEPSSFASGREALGALDAVKPDLIVIAARLGSENGLRLISELRSRPISDRAGIVVVVEDGDFETVATALDLGASDYVMRPVDENELIARARAQVARKRYADRLRANMQDGMRLAVTDELTGAFNRRYVDQHLARLRTRARESGSPLSVVLLDVDRFKAVNDKFGHAAGDRALVEVSRRLQHSVRNVDLVARYGGEEFLVAMPDTSSDEARGVAERIRSEIATTPFDLNLSDGPLDVTISAGVATLDFDGAEPVADAVARADAALYAAKEAGRNRVLVAQRREARPIDPALAAL